MALLFKTTELSIGNFSPKMNNMLFWTAYGFFKLFFGVMFRFPLFCSARIEGRVHMPKRGGLLLVCNHLSIADPPLLWYASPRHICFIGRHDILQMPVLGSLARLAKMIPIKQRGADRAALKQAIERLQAGEVVAIFPEGEVSPSGELMPFLPGLQLIARQAKVPILPVGLLNTDKMVPHGALVPRPAFTRLIVRFGDPIPYEDWMGDKEAGDRLLSLLRERITSLTRS